MGLGGLVVDWALGVIDVSVSWTGWVMGVGMGDVFRVRHVRGIWLPRAAWGAGVGTMIADVRVKARLRPSTSPTYPMVVIPKMDLGGIYDGVEGPTPQEFAQLRASTAIPSKRGRVIDEKNEK